MKPLVDPPTLPRPTVSNPGQPKTLHEAKEMLETLRLENARLKAAAVASPAKPVLPVPTPTMKPINTPGADQPNKTPMPASPPPPKLTLSPDLDSPVKIQKVLDQMNIDDLRLALSSEKDKLRLRCLYLEIKRRENLMSVQN
jgi:hypothetical protein